MKKILLILCILVALGCSILGNTSQFNSVQTKEVLFDFIFEYPEKIIDHSVISVEGYLDWDGRIGKRISYDFHSSKKTLKKGRLESTVIISGKTSAGVFYNLSKCKGQDVKVVGHISLKNNKYPVIYDLSNIFIIQKGKKIQCLNFY